MGVAKYSVDVPDDWQAHFVFVVSDLGYIFAEPKIANSSALHHLLLDVPL